MIKFSSIHIPFIAPLLIFSATLFVPFQAEAVVLTPLEKNAALLGEIPNLDLLFLTEFYGTDELSTISSEGSYSDTGWSYSTTGIFLDNPISLSYTGTFDLNSDIGIFQGSGSYAGETWLSGGIGIFLQDTDELIIDNQVKLGSNSIEAAITAAELIAQKKFPGGGTAISLISGVLIDIIKKTPPPVTPVTPPDSDPSKPGTQVPAKNVVIISGNVQVGGNLIINKNSPNTSVKTECTSTPSQTITCTAQAGKKTPEPTSTLSILTLGTLGAASTLKRKLKSSKPSEKETTKVS